MSVGIRVRAYVLAALFAALVSPQISAQEAHKDAKTLIRQIHFFGDAQLARANQKKFDSLKLSGFAADEAMEKLKERLRYLYQCYGYYKAEIETHAHAVKLNFDEQLLS